MKYCPVFQIDHYIWKEFYKPKAFGQMALLDNYGIVITMTAMEKNPLRRYTEDEDPVYMDSGLEAFLNFNPNFGLNYFNFEMNANGALLSGFGENRNRKKVNEIFTFKALCKAKIKESSWSVCLKIPMELICDAYKIKPLNRGSYLTCNFYKISEDPKIEHYASYAPITNPVPNFHLPEFFASTIII